MSSDEVKYLLLISGHGPDNYLYHRLDEVYILEVIVTICLTEKGYV